MHYKQNMSRTPSVAGLSRDDMWSCEPAVLSSPETTYPEKQQVQLFDTFRDSPNNLYGEILNRVFWRLQSAPNNLSGETTNPPVWLLMGSPKTICKALSPSSWVLRRRPVKLCWVLWRTCSKNLQILLLEAFKSSPKDLLNTFQTTRKEPTNGNRTKGSKDDNVVSPNNMKRIRFSMSRKCFSKRKSF